MKTKEISDFTNNELLIEKNKIRYNKIFSATFIGICFGIFIYSAVNNGLKFFPLILIYIFIRNERKTKELEEEIKSRNL